MPTKNVNDTSDLLAGANMARPIPMACEGQDLKRILTGLADQIADADRRHSTALVAMQERLGALGNSAVGLHEQLPKEMAPALDRLALDQIEGGMTQLTERPADADSQRRGSEPGRGESQAAGERAPALKSALAGDALDAFSRRAEIARGAVSPDFDHFDVVDHVPGIRDPETWDMASAEALTRLYETGEAGPAIPATDTLATAPLAKPILVAAEAATSPVVQAVVPLAVSDPVPSSGPSSGPGTVKAGSALQVVASPRPALDFERQSQDRQWFDGRFSDIAVRLEQSIAGLSKDGQLGSIEARFSSLEQKIGAALTVAPTRADLAGLKNIETQVEDLTAQLITVQTHFGRLDTIELELHSLAERISTEKLAKMMEANAPKAIDNDLLAGVVASRVAKEMPRIEDALQALSDRLSTDRIAALAGQGKSSGPDAAAIAKMVAELVSQQLPKAADASVDPTPRLEELRGMIENFAADQRHGEEQINTMLDTMQQAMIRLLDRMDAIEQGGYAETGAHAADPPAYTEPHGYAEPASQGYAAAEPSSHAHSHAQGTYRDEQLNPGEAQLAAVQSPASPYQAQQAEPSQSVPAQSAAVPANAGSAAPVEQPAGSREDFIAAARRAARKAADAPPEPTAEAEQEAPGQNRKLRAKTSKNGGGRSLSRASMALICLALFGASFAVVKSTILAPSPQPALQQRAPAGTAVPKKSSEADQRVRNLDDADGLVESNQKPPAAGPATAPPRRSSLPGGEVPGNDNGAFPTAILPGNSGFPAAPGDLAAQGLQGAPATPAAFAMDAPPAAARPTSNVMPPISIGPNSLRTAAAKGDPSAEYEIGVRFAEGKGVTQDLQQAIVWYQRSASQGFAPAQYRLGSMYERGLGLKADLARARIWYQRAAEQGIVKAMHNLAVLSSGRDSAATDYVTAAKWFQAAADHGLTDSQFNLAIMQDSGLGMERDTKQAYKWFSLAARAGDDEAARRRESLRAKLSPSELAEVETELRSWRPKPSEEALNDPRQAGEGWKQRAR